MNCPICNSPMAYSYGCGIDYDRYVCVEKDGIGALCVGEIELGRSTHPEDDQ